MTFRLASLVLVLPALAPAAAAQASLFVTSRFTDQVLRYDATSGAFQGVAAAGGGLDNPVGLTFGPGGDLFVVSALTDQVLRYRGSDGAFLGVFAQGGGLDEPRQLGFGPDGRLYVANATTDSILRFDGASGAFLGTFASGGNLDGPTSFAFGPGGDLFVGSVLTDRIKRYDGRSGAYLGNFVKTSLNGPHDLAFGPDGALYVTNAFSTRIQRFDGTTGAFLGTFVQDARLAAPLGLCWDETGALVVVNQGENEVLRYDGRTGAPLGALVTAGAGGLSAPLFACFEPGPALAVLPPAHPVAGAPNLLVVRGARPGDALLLGAGRLRTLPRLVAPLPFGIVLGAQAACPAPLQASVLRAPLVADESGRAFLDWSVPAGLAGETLLLQALEPALCRTSPTVRLRL